MVLGWRVIQGGVVLNPVLLCVFERLKMELYCLFSSSEVVELLLRGPATEIGTFRRHIIID